MAAAKPLTTEAIALTEKKVNMALDDIIKLSKTAGTKPKSMQRIPSKNNKFRKNHTQDKALKVRHFMDSRSSLRQGALVQRRTSFQGNQFSLATEVARKAAVAPLHNRAFSHNRVANTNWSKQRVGGPAVHRRPANGSFPSKQSRHQPYQQKQPLPHLWQGNAGPKQRPQTLDSLFANMYQQRMRAASHQNNAVPPNWGDQQRLPWGRGRFGN